MEPQDVRLGRVILTYFLEDSRYQEVIEDIRKQFILLLKYTWVTWCLRKVSTLGTQVSC